MIMRNGKTAAGWRLDEVKADMPVGMEMLMNPFAIVPKEENAERIVKAFEALESLERAAEVMEKYADWPSDNADLSAAAADARAALAGVKV